MFYLSKSLIFVIICFLNLTSLTVRANDPIVAEVNGIKVYKSELDKKFTQNKLFVSNKILTREKVLNDIIHRIIGIKKAKKEKLDRNPVVKEKMEDVLYHAQVSKDLEGKFKKIDVSKSDLTKYYNGNKEYRLAHILFRMRARPSAKETKAATKKSIETYNILKKSPAKFAELANKLSQTSVAPNGGDLGYVPAFRLAPEMAKVVQGKAMGHITSPIRTQFGIHIVKILAVKQFKDINQSMYKKVIYDQKRDKIIAAYFQSLRKKAKIKINKNFL